MFSVARFARPLVVFALIASSFGGWPQPAAAAQPPAVIPLALVYGDVRDARAKTAETVVPNDLPGVANAELEIPALGVSARTDSRGRFVLDSVTAPNQSLATASAKYVKVAVRVSARGFGDWKATGIPLNIGTNATRLYIELNQAPTKIKYVPAEERVKPRVKGATAKTGPGWASPGPSPSGTSGCTGYGSQYMPTGQVRLYRTASNTLETVNFNFYVRGVLPREWFPTDPLEALKPGALAIREYSWYWTNNWRGGIVPSGPYVGQCYDLSDDPGSYQDYDPTRASAASDTAVSAMWDWKMADANGIFDAQYASGFSGEACGANATGVKMFQSGTVTCANQSLKWWEIVDRYYYAGIARSTIGAGPAATATAQTANNNLDVFVRGANGNIYQTGRRGPRGSSWFTWFDLGQPPGGSASDPGAAWSSSGNRIDVAVRGNDDNLWVKTWTPGTGWQAWVSRALNVTQGPGGAAQRNGTPVDFFTRDAGLQETLNRYDGFNWNTLGSMGAPTGLHDATLPWRPSGVWWAPLGFARLDTFVTSNDIDNGLYQNYSTDFGTSWVGWISVADQTGVKAKMSSATSVAAYTSGNQIDVFLRGLDNTIYRIYWDGVAWRTWTTIGAPAGTGSGPGATWADLDQELDVFVRGDDNHLYWRSLVAGSWTSWADLAAYP